MKKSLDFIQARRKMFIGSQKTGARVSLVFKVIRTKINFTARMK